MATITCDSSLAEFQARNNALYRDPNDFYTTEILFGRMLRHSTNVLKAVRKHRADPDPDIMREKVVFPLCMACSWTLALFNRFHIDLADDMWKRFPGLCPYCALAPCDCINRSLERKKMVGMSRGQKPLLLRDWQKMFAQIYPNVIQDSASHLAEEAGEVHEALQAYAATHTSAWFEKAIEELVDVVTQIFAVANCLRIDLSQEMTRYFAQGCPGCKNLPCTCGFVVAG